ncbi:hypothetical protein MAPG_07902 [Magnaporthiopsis poae ATCC 64411]|uniref:Secreted protein n=1 Tax=Magnaporthiopsis poae (strain ATCC 64411 / 73-15) TaxID=644358 RepID=A0A0C4E5X4_MAGP6|nr:hypothetical protein MAPG_07902 [Magnaporthiopsis poae ATCC 64411]
MISRRLNLFFILFAAWHDSGQSGLSGRPECARACGNFVITERRGISNGARGNTHDRAAANRTSRMPPAEEKLTQRDLLPSNSIAECGTSLTVSAVPAQLFEPYVFVHRRLFRRMMHVTSSASRTRGRFILSDW